MQSDNIYMHPDNIYLYMQPDNIYLYMQPDNIYMLTYTTYKT